MVSLLTEQTSAYFGVSVNEPESIFTITLYLELSLIHISEPTRPY